MIPDDKPMFLLGPIAATLRWLEELANLLSGPLLVAGLAIALIDLLTDGALLTTVPALLYAWAISQAVGVDAQLIGAFDRAKRAVLRRQWWHVAGLFLLGCMLAYVAYVAGYVFAVQESAHISEAAALSRLGMSATTWLWQRVGVSVFLVCLSGYTRYRAPRQTTLADEQERLQRELTLEPLRQRVRGVKLAGVRMAATALVGSPTAQPDMPLDAATMATTAREHDDATTLPDNAFTSPAGSYGYVEHTPDDLNDLGVRTPQETPDDTTPPTHPTGPGTPITAPSRSRQRRSSQPAILRLTPDRQSLRQQRQAAQGQVRTPGTTSGNDSLEAVARQAYAAGATSIPKMRRATGMGQSAAQSYVRMLKAEAAATTSPTGAPNAGQRILPAPTLPLPGDSFRGVLTDDASAEAGEGYAL